MAEVGREADRERGRVVAWGVPRKRIDPEKLIHALLLVRADLERAAVRARENPDSDGA